MVFSSKKQLALDEEIVEFYTLENNKNRKKDSIIFYFTGTGCHSVSFVLEKELKFLSENARIVAIQKKGVSHLDTGKKCSSEYLENEKLSSQLERQKRAITKILKEKKYQNISMCGSSEGAIIAARLANEIPVTTKLIIEVFDISKPIKEVLRHVYTSDGQESLFNRIETKIENPNLPNNENITNRHLDTWRELTEHKTLSEYIKNMPTLLILGEKDTRIPVASYKTACKHLMSDKKQILLSTRIFRNAGHSLDGLKIVVQKTIQDWLSNRPSRTSSIFYSKEC